MPIEVAWIETRGDPTAYGFQIRRARGERDANLEVFAFVQASPTEGSPLPLNVRTETGSLPDIADAPAALTVAAIEALPSFPIEDFSSEGPTNGPGGAPTGGLRKPDLASYDGVSTASYGARNFYGNVGLGATRRRGRRPGRRSQAPNGPPNRSASFSSRKQSTWDRVDTTIASATADSPSARPWSRPRLGPIPWSRRRP